MRLFATKLATGVLAILALTACLPFAAADQPLSKMKVRSATLTFSDGGFAVLGLTGMAEALGKCSAYGELVFVPGEDEDTLDGMGVAAFTAADGDVLVGVIAAQIDEDNRLTWVIHWRDTVTFSDGTTVASTGRFVDNRPPGATGTFLLIK
jgi:ABC-type transport system substrate-binding protein